MRLHLTKVVPLLRRLMMNPDSTLFHPKIEAKREVRLGEDLVFDDYCSRREVRRVVVALHGVTVLGKDDPRLQHFARCLAISGIRCVVPALPGLANLQWDTADIGCISRVIDQLVSEGHDSISLVGFSFGASYALLAAAAQEPSSPIELVMAFGPYHSLVELYDYFRQWQSTTPTSEEEEDSLIYLHAVMAHRQRAVLGLSQETEQTLDTLLERYCNAATVEEKRVFFESSLTDLAVISVDAEQVDNESLAHLSPAGALGSLSCPVGLIHDRADTLVPWEHSERIFGELSAARPELGHRLLVTSLLQHVRPSNVLALREGVQMMRLISMLWDTRA